MSTLKPRTATKMIYQGDDLEQLAHLHRAAEVARRRAAQADVQRLGDDAPSSADEEAAYDAFVIEAEGRAIEVRIEDIGARRFRALAAEHEPRQVDRDGQSQTHPDDFEYGVNVETFSFALLAYDQDDRRTIVAPRLSGQALREFLEDELSEGDYDDLFELAYHLNRGRPDPKASGYLIDSPDSKLI